LLRINSSHFAEKYVRVHIKRRPAPGRDMAELPSWVTPDLFAIIQPPALDEAGLHRATDGDGRG
jgi:hypothetical protein